MTWEEAMNQLICPECNGPCKTTVRVPHTSVDVHLDKDGKPVILEESFLRESRYWFTGNITQAECAWCNRLYYFRDGKWYADKYGTVPVEMVVS